MSYPKALITVVWRLRVYVFPGTGLSRGSAGCTIYRCAVKVVRVVQLEDVNCYTDMPKLGVLGENDCC